MDLEFGSDRYGEDPSLEAVNIKKVTNDRN